jgi:ubiquinone/menaquinone biosynthesis C-methylase UbiE
MLINTLPTRCPGRAYLKHRIDLMANTISTSPTYTGKFSEIYDLFYTHKTYTQEADFVQSLLVKFGNQPTQKILELGCGTGTHSFLLEAYGHEIVATDLSEDMIRTARAKAEARGSKIQFTAQDMIQLDQPARPFDAVICLFDSFCYVTENEDIETVLNRVNQHLKPGGLFIFEFWNAPAMIQHLDPVRVARLRHGEDEILKLSEAKLDYHRQLYQVNYTLYERKADGRCQVYTEQHSNRYYQVQEMAYFLSQAGLQPLKWYAGYTEDETLTDATWNVLCVARTC